MATKNGVKNKKRGAQVASASELEKLLDGGKSALASAASSSAMTATRGRLPENEDFPDFDDAEVEKPMQLPVPSSTMLNLIHKEVVLGMGGRIGVASEEGARVCSGPTVEWHFSIRV